MFCIISHYPLLFPAQADMKMTYTELSVIGRLRKISMCGPFSMFCKLIHLWKDRLSPVEVGFLLFLSFGQMFMVMMNFPLVHFSSVSLLNCICRVITHSQTAPLMPHESNLGLIFLHLHDIHGH